jgi:acyl carrier protein
MNLRNGNIRALVRSFVEQKLEIRGLIDFADDAPLVEAGILDSLGMFEFIAFIESNFGIHVSDQEIVLSNFESIDATAAFIERKQVTP